MQKGDEDDRDGSLKRFDQITGNIDEVIFMFSPDWQHAIYVSPAYEKIWGRNTDDVYRNPLSWLDAIVPGDRDRVAALVRGQACGKVPYEVSVEYRIEGRYGTLRWISARTYPVKDAEGNIISVTGIATDVTGRKAAEERLQNSERFLNNIFDCFQDGISILDKDLNIVRVNHMFEKWHFDTVPHEGKKCYKAYQGRSVPCEKCPSLRAMELGTAQSEILPLPRKRSAGTVWIEIFSFPFRDNDGNIIGVIEHVRDITPRKEAEDALRDSEEKYRSLVENINDMVWEIDADFRVTYASSRTLDIMGYEVDEVRGKRPFDFILKDDLDRFGSLINDAVRARAPLELMGYRVVRKDGRIIYMETNGMPIFNGDGSFRGYRGINRDITERRQSDEALRESEERFRATFEQAAVGMTMVDFKGRFLKVNQKFCDIVGYSSDELAGISAKDITYAPDFPEEKELIGRLIRGETGTFSREKRYIRKDGSLVWVLLTVTMIYENGVPKNLIGVTQDITERKRAEKSLKLTQLTVDLAGDMVLWVAPDARFIYVNQAACKTFGYTREEMMSMTTFDTCPSWTDESWAEHWNEIRERGSFTLEAMLRRKDGSFFPGEISVNHIVYGGKEYNCSFIRDISDRKQAEEALKESEEKFRILAETTGAGIVLYRGKNFVYVNPTFEKITGYNREELLKMNYWDVVHPDSKELVRGRGMARQRGLKVPSTYEFKIVTKGGEIKWVELSAATINYAGMRMTLATIFDVTGRKRSEKELQEAKGQAELYLDLMGHDINNMNQIGIGFLEMALSTLKLDRESRELIAKPLEALEASTKLIANVRKLQKIKDGGLKFQEINVGEMISGIIPRYRDAGGREISIRYAGGAGCKVIANDLLDDVFSNIIGNAIKHSSGPLTIDVDVSEARVGERKYCIVAIQDNGPGIPDDLKDRLFTRHEHGKIKSGGRGLGLYLVKMLVEDFHGKAWVEDRVQGDHTKGTRFMIMLPAVE